MRVEEFPIPDFWFLTPVRVNTPSDTFLWHATETIQMSFSTTPFTPLGHPYLIWVYYCQLHFILISFFAFAIILLLLFLTFFVGLSDFEFNLVMVGLGNLLASNLICHNAISLPGNDAVVRPLYTRHHQWHLLNTRTSLLYLYVN